MDASGNGLVAKAGRGDAGALDALVRQSYAPVWRTVHRFTRDRHSADGLTQEAFLRACANLATFRGECRFTTWVSRIALNLAMNERRRLRPGPMPAREPAAAGTSPDREAERSELRDRVRAAIAELPEPFAQALLLTFFGGVSHAEAAAELGCAEGTVAWRVHEAKKRIREVLPHEL
jgi:RNA polymerase sigma-70 factor (ECF subfamily)